MTSSPTFLTTLLSLGSDARLHVDAGICRVVSLARAPQPAGVALAGELGVV